MLNDENVILYLTLGDMSYKRQGYKECHRFAYINSRWKSSRVTHGTDQVAVKHKLAKELTLECAEWLAVCWIMKCVATLRSHLKQNLIYTLPFCNTWSVKDGQGSNSAHVSCWSKTTGEFVVATGLQMRTVAKVRRHDGYLCAPWPRSIWSNFEQVSHKIQGLFLLCQNRIDLEDVSSVWSEITLIGLLCCAKKKKKKSHSMVDEWTYNLQVVRRLLDHLSHAPATVIS